MSTICQIFDKSDDIINEKVDFNVLDNTLTVAAGLESAQYIVTTQITYTKATEAGIIDKCFILQVDKPINAENLVVPLVGLGNGLSALRVGNDN